MGSFYSIFVNFGQNIAVAIALQNSATVIRCLPSVCLSVCMQVYCDQTIEARMTRFPVTRNFALIFPTKFY